MKIAGISFDHMHMGDLLRLAHENPNCEVVGVSDDNPANADSVQSVVRSLEIPQERVYSDYRALLDEQKPDLVILCSSTGSHGDWVRKIAPYNANVLVEKPFASSLQDADAMIAAMQKSGKIMVVNWPLAWYPPHLTAKRLIDEGAIGELIEVHYYDGNRGPMRHVADKVEVTEAEAAARKSESWFYQREAGGGSLQDYLGYGTTLGTWYLNNRAPLEVACMVDEPRGLFVDEHSVTVARYEFGLSKFETRWGTFTDPWILQPQPKTGFTLVGTRGTITSYDYEQTIRVQSDAQPEGEIVPVDAPKPNLSNAIEHLVDVIQNNAPIHGPLRPDVCRIGQQIVDSAALAAREKRTVSLLG